MASGKQQARRDAQRLRRFLGQVERRLDSQDRRLLEPEGLCGSDLDILDHLARKGTRPVNGLARRVGLTSGSITTAVQRLKKRGLVETARDPRDKRRVLVTITDDGRELATGLTKRRGKILDQALGAWSRRERSVALNLLKRLRRHLDTNPAPDNQSPGSSP